MLGGVRCANGLGCTWVPGVFAARTGAEKVSFAWRVGEFQLRLCRRPTRGRQSPRPLDPGLRPASPPLRGPFASSGFLTDRRDAPSLARTRLFAASLPLVLKSLIRSAVLTASLPAFNSSFCVGYVVVVSPEDYLCLSAGQEEWPSTLSTFYLFFLCWVRRPCKSGGLSAALCRAGRVAFHTILCWLFFLMLMHCR